eukprot:CAMPEP_0183351720 /NCGR_PEP_ID=MMETSP0164_2-20130417/26212_1 /TAXON_ID=221442 /ORGANISM="Coccolithus pelagicus ssp braarudi, Strain PLY182g" /LENGTH=191 /DNA_ID=CAMNT_0025523975 /DNA_START=128 /DNA_END=703 /DNA_ORIENTATION=+
MHRSQVDDGKKPCASFDITDIQLNHAIAAVICWEHRKESLLHRRISSGKRLSVWDLVEVAVVHKLVANRDEVSHLSHEVVGKWPSIVLSLRDFLMQSTVAITGGAEVSLKKPLHFLCRTDDELKVIGDLDILEPPAPIRYTGYNFASSENYTPATEGRSEKCARRKAALGELRSPKPQSAFPAFRQPPAAH